MKIADIYGQDEEPKRVLKDHRPLITSKLIEQDESTMIDQTPQKTKHRVIPGIDFTWLDQIEKDLGMS